MKKDADEHSGFIDTPTLSADETSPYEEWTCTVTATDGIDDGPADEASVTIINTAPSAPEVEISPEIPSEEDDLECDVVTDSEDPEGDEVSYSYAWSLDGVDAGVTDTTLDADETSLGDEWTCTVTPNDGTEDGESGSASLIIPNTACSSLSFDGSNDYVTVSDDSDFSFGSDDFTIEMYAQIGSSCGSAVSDPACALISHDEGDGIPEKWMLVYADDTTSWHPAGFTFDVVGDGEGDYFQYEDSSTVGTWAHVAMVRSGTDFYLFLDGILVSTDEISGDLVDPAADLMIGRAEDLFFFEGELDEVHISSEARYTTDFEPELTFTSDSSTIALWHFDEGTGSTVADDSGNGHDGTISGASWSTDCPEG